MESDPPMPASDEPLPPEANGTTANGGVCEWVGMEGMEWVGGDREVSVWRWGVWRWSGGWGVRFRMSMHCIHALSA